MLVFKALDRKLKWRNSQKSAIHVFVEFALDTRGSVSRTEIRRSLKGHLIWQVSKWSTARANKSFRADAF